MMFSLFGPKRGDQLDRVERKLDVVLALLKGASPASIPEGMEDFMADIKAQVAELVGKVKEQKTVIDGTAVLLQGLRDQIAQAQGTLDAAGESEASAALGELSKMLAENTEALGKAMAAQTDADDEVHAHGM